MNQAPTESPGQQSGVALVLALIFAILLYILVAELVVSGRMVRLVGENDIMIARQRNQLDYTLKKVEDMLLEDMASASSQQGGNGGGPLSGAPSAGAGPGGDQGGSDPAATCDSSRDQWFQPQGFADGDLTTYAWVEDENRKLNLLTLWSPDADYARFCRDRLIRLLDKMREDTEFDLSSSDAERIVREIEDWAKRPGTDSIPRPKLKTDDDRARDITLPMTLDELLMLPSVTEDLFFDKVLDGKVILGLESVLTVWTALMADPGDPDKLARQQAKAQQGGAQPASPPPPPASPPDPNAPPPQPVGEGIRVNINTAPRCVLRALFPPDRIPDLVIDAIIKYRNTEEEPDPKTQAAQGSATADFGNLQLGSDKKYKVFAEVSDLEQLPEFANLPDPQIKADFQRACTTHSDVFSIHLASLYRRNEEKRVFVLRRARTIVMRRDNGSDGYLYPLVLQEERHGLRVMPVDLQDKNTDLSLTYSELDSFAQEDRAWNPFLVDFYLPPHIREQFYRKQ
jgi:hypothetical protein